MAIDETPPDPARELVDSLRTSGIALSLREGKLVVKADDMAAEQQSFIRANANAIAQRLGTEAKQQAALMRFLADNPEFPPMGDDRPVPPLLYVEAFGQWHCVCASAYARWLAELNMTCLTRREIRAREAAEQNEKIRRRVKKQNKGRKKRLNHLPHLRVEGLL